MGQSLLSGVRYPAIGCWVESTYPRIVRANPYLCPINTNRGDLIAREPILRCIGGPNLGLVIINSYTAIRSKPDALTINGNAANFIARQTIFCCNSLPGILADVVLAHTASRTDPYISLAAGDTPDLIRD